LAKAFTEYFYFNVTAIATVKIAGNHSKNNIAFAYMYRVY